MKGYPISADGVFSLIGTPKQMAQAVVGHWDELVESAKYASFVYPGYICGEPELMDQYNRALQSQPAERFRVEDMPANLTEGSVKGELYGPLNWSLLHIGLQVGTNRDLSDRINWLCREGGEIPRALKPLLEEALDVSLLMRHKAQRATKSAKDLLEILTTEDRARVKELSKRVAMPLLSVASGPTPINLLAFRDGLGDAISYFLRIHKIERAQELMNRFRTCSRSF